MKIDQLAFIQELVIKKGYKMQYQYHSNKSLTGN